MKRVFERFCRGLKQVCTLLYSFSAAEVALTSLNPYMHVWSVGGATDPGAWLGVHVERASGLHFDLPL